MAEVAIKRDDDDQVIRRRLLYDGHGYGEDKRLVSIAKGITKLFLVPHSDGDFSKQQLLVTKQIELALDSADRQVNVSFQCDRSIQEITEQIESEDQRLQQLRAEVVSLKSELDFVQKLKQLNSLQDCKKTEAQISEIEKKNERMQAKMIGCKEKICLLMKSCCDLKKVLDDD